ncbi:hypothetical protein LSAT2_010384 [Lamellibrachia satsuma]|nr:hypothetical protein LSAT2_010384 [Lamellibrachia satsuma]
MVHSYQAPTKTAPRPLFKLKRITDEHRPTPAPFPIPIPISRAIGTGLHLRHLPRRPSDAGTSPKNYSETAD